MTTNFKLSIPEPCHENWGEMTTTQSGRFCGVCTKNVVDFTNKLPHEIQQYFQNTSETSVCGRLSNAQLDQIVILIPKKTIMTQRSYQNIFLMALFVVMGTTLFSCKDHSNQKKSIQKIEIVKDTIIHQERTTGIMMPPSDSANNAVPPPPPPPPPSIKDVKFIKPQREATKTVGIIYIKPVISDTVHSIVKGKIKKDTISRN